MRTLAALLATAAVSTVFAGSPACAKTLVLEGKMHTTAEVSQRLDFHVSKPLNSLEYRFALPTGASTDGTTQHISDLVVSASPSGYTLTEEIDRFGNRFAKFVWIGLSDDAEVALSFTAEFKNDLRKMGLDAPFPPKGLDGRQDVFLEPTALAQSDDAEIMAMARKLTSRAKTEHSAVSAVVDYVSSSIAYNYSPPQTDAVYALRTKSGNCQSFAHLCSAMLRSVGIPVRFVGGMTLKDKWTVPSGKGQNLVQKMGQGRHAWIEVYFPGTGWLPYDPQQSKQFTSTRHIKFTQGRDAKDICNYWQGSPYLPRVSESLIDSLPTDKISLRLKKTEPGTRGYLMSNEVVSAVEAVKPSQGASRPQPEGPTTPKPPVGSSFGNMEFPTLVDKYRVDGNVATQLFEMETAEYVTSNTLYAQAFTVDTPLRLGSVSLAMHKFGGDGAVYVDLVSDNGGKPGKVGLRSALVYLDQLKLKPGYYWIDFRFSGQSKALPPGKYWIVLRHSGEAVLDWFFTLGKHHGDADGTRSTSRGYLWEDVLNYEFVFKVTPAAKRFGKS